MTYAWQIYVACTHTMYTVVQLTGRPVIDYSWQAFPIEKGDPINGRKLIFRNIYDCNTMQVRYEINFFSAYTLKDGM